MSDAGSRALILGALRRALRQGRPLPDDTAALLAARLAAPPRHPVPARSLVPHAARGALLTGLLEREQASVRTLGSLAELPGAVAEYLAAQNLPAAAVLAPHPDLAAAPWGEPPWLAIRTGLPNPEDQVGIQVAWAGIAETGTLVFPSGPTRPTTLNLLPETEIVLLRTSRVVGPPEEAFARWRRTRGPGLPRSLMLVSGPSRSSDIEHTQEFGAHGPRRLHVLLLDDGPPS